VQIIIGSGPRLAGRRAFARLGSLLVEVGRSWRPARAVLEVNFIGERRMAMLNRMYRGRRGPATILTFSYARSGTARASSGPIGEIYLCWPRIIRAAREVRVSTRSYVLRLFVHGLMHLRGYRHDTATNEARMERVERELLSPFLCDSALKRLFP
jgi:probable rRNA maturation factor